MGRRRVECPSGRSDAGAHQEAHRRHGPAARRRPSAEVGAATPADDTDAEAGHDAVGSRAVRGRR